MMQTSSQSMVTFKNFCIPGDLANTTEDEGLPVAKTMVTGGGVDAHGEK